MPRGAAKGLSHPEKKKSGAGRRGKQVLAEEGEDAGPERGGSASTKKEKTRGALKKIKGTEGPKKLIRSLRPRNKAGGKSGPCSAKKSLRRLGQEESVETEGENGGAAPWEGERNETEGGFGGTT